MSEQRFQKTRIVDKWGGIYDSETDEVLGVNDVEHKLNEQEEIINKLRKILAEAEDMIEVRLAEHYLKEYENIKHNIIGDE